MSEGKKIRWTIASARQHFPTLVDLAVREPQDIYRRNELVARVVPADATSPPVQRPTASEFLAGLQRICAEQDFELPVSPRVDRPNAMVDALTRRVRKRSTKPRAPKRTPRR